MFQKVHGVTVNEVVWRKNPNKEIRELFGESGIVKVVKGKRSDGLGTN